MGCPPHHQWECSHKCSLHPWTRVTHHVHHPAPYLFTSGLRHPFLFWHWQQAQWTVVGLCLLNTKNGEGRHQQGMLDRCGAHAMHGQDWLQSVKPPAMVLLLLPLLVTHTDCGEEDPYLRHLHAPIPWFLSTYIVSPRPNPALHSQLTPLKN